MRRTLAVFAFQSLLALVAAFPGAASALDISGVWRLNAKLSDDPSDKLRAALAAQRNDGDSEDGPDADRGPGDYRGAAGFRRMHRDEGGGPRSGMPMLVAAKVQIVQDGPEITLIYDDRRQRTIYTDGRGTTVTASGSMTGGPMGQSLASWSGDELHVETNASGQPRLFENFSLIDNGSRLRIAFRLDLPMARKPVEILRVYDRVPDGAAGTGMLM